MCLDGCSRDEQALADLGVGEALGGEADHFDLRRRQTFPTDCGPTPLAACPRGVRRGSLEVELFALGPQAREGVLAQTVTHGRQRGLPCRLLDGIALISH